MGAACLWQWRQLEQIGDLVLVLRSLLQLLSEPDLLDEHPTIAFFVLHTNSQNVRLMIKRV